MTRSPDFEILTPESRIKINKLNKKLNNYE